MPPKYTTRVKCGSQSLNLHRPAYRMYAGYITSCRLQRTLKNIYFLEHKLTLRFQNHFFFSVSFNIFQPGMCFREISCGVRQEQVERIAFNGLEESYRDGETQLCKFTNLAFSQPHPSWVLVANETKIESGVLVEFSFSRHLTTPSRCRCSEAESVDASVSPGRGSAFHPAGAQLRLVMRSSLDSVYEAHELCVFYCPAWTCAHHRNVRLKKYIIFSTEMYVDYFIYM